MLLDDDHMASPLHQWHAVLELKQRDRGAPTPPSTGGDWELLSPAKAGSACGSSAHSDNEEAVVDEAAPPVDIIDTSTLLLSTPDVPVDAPAGKVAAGDDNLTHLGITWLVSWFSPHVACPTVANLNDYVHQVRMLALRMCVYGCVVVWRMRVWMCFYGCVFAWMCVLRATHPTIDPFLGVNHLTINHVVTGNAPAAHLCLP